MFDSVEEQVTIKVYMNHNFSVKRMKCRSGIEPPNYAGSVSAVWPALPLGQIGSRHRSAGTELVGVFRSVGLRNWLDLDPTSNNNNDNKRRTHDTAFHKINKNC